MASSSSPDSASDGADNLGKFASDRQLTMNSTGTPSMLSDSHRATRHSVLEPPSQPMDGASPSSEGDYQALYNKIRNSPITVAHLTMLHEEEPGRPPLRTRQELIDRELERVYKWVGGLVARCMG
jgi:hypothetical protein